MGTLLHWKWSLMTPEMLLAGAAVLLLLLDLFTRKTGKNATYFADIAFLATVGALVSLLFLYRQPTAQILDGTFVLDGFAKACKTVLLGGGALLFLIARDTKGIVARAEYHALLLTALLGALFMASSNDFITLFVGLELLSLSSYILVGMRKASRKSNEAAMKYIINGGISTAVILFGMSYLYGMTGLTNITKMQALLAEGVQGGFELLILLAFLLVFIGLSFKIATVPFHMWAPDVYEGAATPVTAFLSTISKMAGFFLIARLFLLLFSGISLSDGGSVFGYMQIFIAVVAGLTMIVGNIAALRQQHVKRLFAYSGIAHAGYLLVPLATLSPFTLDSMWFYVVAYVVMNVGVFTIIHGLSQEGQHRLDMFRGLWKRSPRVAIMMTIFILSLAGIPGTAGFVGKLHIFLGAFAGYATFYVLPALLMTTTIISFIYYFRIVQLMFFRDPEGGKITLPIRIEGVAFICAVLTIVLGIFPSLGYNVFYENFSFTKDFFYRGENK